MNVAVLLLAAGYARRFGSDKRLLQLNENNARQQSVLEYTLSKYRQVFEPCAVVVRDADPARELLKNHQGIAVVRQYQAQAGMGDNLALGVEYLLPQQCDAVAIALADMPLVRIETLSALKTSARQDCIVCPVFDGQRGHPVIFGRRFFSQLAQLDGDVGARGVVAANLPDVIDVDCGDEGVIVDIDSPADWLRLRGKIEGSL